MRLAGEQEQHRALRAIDQPRQPRAIAQQERRALVGGKAARKAERQHVGPLRIEQARDVPQLRDAQALARVFAPQALAHAASMRAFTSCAVCQKFCRAPLERLPERRIDSRSRQSAPSCDRRSAPRSAPGRSARARHW
jgi:hypothetical protein